MKNDGTRNKNCEINKARARPTIVSKLPKINVIGFCRFRYASIRLINRTSTPAKSDPKIRKIIAPSKILTMMLLTSRLVMPITNQARVKYAAPITPPKIAKIIKITVFLCMFTFTSLQSYFGLTRPKPVLTLVVTLTRRPHQFRDRASTLEGYSWEWRSA